jgi:hypothetical protein
MSKGIDPDEVYAIVDDDGLETGQYGYTPDGFGMIWYDTEIELLTDTGLDPNRRVEITSKELDRIRGEAEAGQ